MNCKRCGTDDRYPGGQCKVCKARYRRTYKAKHASYMIAWHKAYHKAKRDAQALYPRTDRCEVCGALGDVVWDHDHETGLHRGWLCRKCNMAIGLFDDEITKLTGAIKYLKVKRRG